MINVVYDVFGRYDVCCDLSFGELIAQLGSAMVDLGYVPESVNAITKGISEARALSMLGMKELAHQKILEVGDCLSSISA